MNTLEIKGDRIITNRRLKPKLAMLMGLQIADMLMAGNFNAGRRIRYWGRMGAFWGAILGLGFGSSFVFVPRDGPLLMTGPLVAWALLALAGAMVLGGLGALGAGIYNLGIAHDSILESETAFNPGMFAVAANDSAGQTILARNAVTRSPAGALG